MKITKIGWVVLRFDNKEVKKDLQKVTDIILAI